ncbi:hypothetical protein D6853_10245 [Butyrivibrio sp. X503]|uniref:hypothetical protein n=1 Tax=Butyrivibrio sp. X503 TaxID=2364878 RepID=UPI000EA9E2DB|nr:hypothetical protein [Butyrivibrio sp. X503]RKM55109.1 hypothetical protein D6853_10245 [Butyrivibrio sp. X503]
MKSNNVVFVAMLVLTVICFFANGYGGYGKNICNNYYKTTSIYLEDEDKDRQEELLIGKYSSVEDAIADLNIEPLQRYDWDDTIFFSRIGVNESDLSIISYRYNSKSGELYQFKDLHSWIDIKNARYDGFWYDYAFAQNITWDCLDNYKYIPGTNEHGDIFYGVWIGDEIKTIKIKKGIFSYIPLECDIDSAYFWTYELENSKDLLNSVAKPVENSSTHYKCDLGDVKKLLGIKCKLLVDRRMIIYWGITLILSVLLILSVYKTYSLNSEGGHFAARVVMWFLSVFLCIMVSTLISYYLSNPRLFFGIEGIDKYIAKFTGWNLPNVH